MAEKIEKRKMRGVPYFMEKLKILFGSGQKMSINDTNLVCTDSKRPGDEFGI
jgi:hypothetical protein